MRILVVVGLGWLLLGCGALAPPSSPGGGVDMAEPSGPGIGGNGGGAVDDMATVPAPADLARAPAPDLGPPQDLGGLQPFGAACARDTQCASNVCFVGGMQSFCSLRCTPATAAQDCPTPPSSGVCNNQGYCK